MKSDPIFSLNKQHVSSVIADEWKQIGTPQPLPNFLHQLGNNEEMSDH